MRITLQGLVSVGQDAETRTPGHCWWDGKGVAAVENGLAAPHKSKQDSPGPRAAL